MAEKFSEEKVEEGFPAFFYTDEKTFKFSLAGERWVVYENVDAYFSKRLFVPDTLEPFDVAAKINEAFANGQISK